MPVLSVVQYYPQTDSATGHAGRMCFSSSCAMAVKFLRPDALKGSNADDDYLRTVLKYGDTTICEAQVKACAAYGITASYHQNGKFTDLFSEIDKGFPVAVGVLHKGTITNPRGGGHWMLMIGYDSTYGIFHDPYGEMDMVNGDYVTVGRGGKGVRYSLKNFGRRWMVEGPGSGWYLTFRPSLQIAKPSSSAVQLALPLIKEFEGCNLKAYPDPETGGSPWTIGWGSTKDTAGRPFKRGDVISQAQADGLLQAYVEADHTSLMKNVPAYPKLKPNQQAALLSFTYNVGRSWYGADGFTTISTALKNEDFKKVPAALMLYVNPGGPSEVGLRRRRAAEGALWNE